MTENTYITDIAPLVPIKAWTRGVPIESEAVEQLRNVANLPFVHHHVAVMPDVHFGIGATVGSVIPTIGAIVPAAVGVDIGCGMIASRTSLRAADLPDSLAGIRSAIEAAVPHGRTHNGRTEDRGAWGEVPLESIRVWNEMWPRLVPIVQKHSKLERAGLRAPHHIGTLGTGNHFIEICLDENQDVWVMLHSGSRGIGNAIGQYFIHRAKDHMRRWFINLPDADLAYLPEGEQDFKDYIEAVSWAQEFALNNRLVMMNATMKAIVKAMNNPNLMFNPIWETDAVNCHHNYVSRERHFGHDVWLTRKGAVSAKEGQLGIIPGSMGVRSFIVRGLGNRESFQSCSHGAGRRMSRGEARRTFTVEDHIKATEGVECRKDESVLDETPGAYKDVDAVMAAQSDLVEIVHTLKQVCCVKG